ncbi:MAG: DUF1294 domain-containing protein [Anaerovorax sp.]
MITFAMMGIDKSNAIRGRWRISEKTLILSALLLGGVGSWLGMTAFRHKTKHMKFRILLPVAALETLIVVYLLY